MKTQEIEKPLEWSELGTDPIETVAQEAKRVLSLIPEERWCMHVFHNEQTGQACALGHYSKHERNVYGDSLALRRLSAEYIKSVTGSELADISGVNNGDYIYLNRIYPQKTPKQRVIALLDDMIKAGY